MVHRRSVAVGSGLALLLLLALHEVPWRRSGPPVESLPSQLSDREFWNLINDFSERGGTFRSDNFVSNESAFQHAIPELKRRIKPGGVYMGVGPDQNFTYIAALQPKLAFIPDIRRQNMLLHLMYKALFEISTDRAEFLSNLFARPLTTQLRSASTTEHLFEVLHSEKQDDMLAETTLSAILRRLRVDHQFPVNSDDSRTIETVYRAFVSGGPEIRYAPYNQNVWRRFPSYSELMLENDGTGENGDGENQSYMASEENFRVIKKLQSENRIVPLVGDFAGDQALRSVGRYLADHAATLSVFYTSNVEFYLFQTDDWRRFLNNVAEFPMNRDSVVIRSYFNNSGNLFPPPPGSSSLPRSVTLVDSMTGLVSAFESGNIRYYFDVIRRSVPSGDPWRGVRERSVR